MRSSFQCGGGPSARSRRPSVLRGRRSLVPRRGVGRVRVGLGRCRYLGWGCSSGSGCRLSLIRHLCIVLRIVVGWYAFGPRCVCRRGFVWLVLRWHRWQGRWSIGSHPPDSPQRLVSCLGCLVWRCGRQCRSWYHCCRRHGCGHRLCWWCGITFLPNPTGPGIRCLPNRGQVRLLTTIRVQAAGRECLTPGTIR